MAMNMTMSAPTDYNRLLKQRDGLINHLRRQRVAGVVSAGLSRRGGEPVLMVLVRPTYREGVPEEFDGTTVVVSAVDNATA
jgi:hypothetical protein